MKRIKLTQGQYALVDDDDFEPLNVYKWHFQRNGFGGRARRYLKECGNKNVYMHREIMKAPSYLQVDHINGNPLDNRKENLRLCTNSQNTMNARPQKGRKYKGVTWHKSSRKWRALITVNKKQLYLGQYDSDAEAAKAYDKAAIVYFKEFARINFQPLGISY